MKIGIVGQGFVGTAVHEGLKQYYKIETYVHRKPDNEVYEIVNVTIKPSQRVIPKS